SNAPPEAHFGLGPAIADAPPLKVRVTWPDGRASDHAVERGARTVLVAPSQER
ncbi:MAG: hypothetical protein EBR10_08870, partial [Planctomycetes bacterium]|nr:hypothetical protein [Planctomycetota bacterium]